MQPFKGQSKETLNGCFRSTKKFQKANKWFQSMNKTFMIQGQ